MSAGHVTPPVNGSTPRWLREPSGKAAPTVAALCEEFSEVCESAVDPLEVASALEFDGFSDRSVRGQYDVDDVFALARAMYLRVPRRPAYPAPRPEPWPAGPFRPLLHGLIYALPAACFPAAAGLLHGPAVVPTLVLALLVAWGLSQGLACVGYLRRAGSADEDQVKRVLRAGLAAGLVLVGLAMAAAGLAWRSHWPVLVFGAGEGLFMLGACVLMVTGTEIWLLAALAPGVTGSVVFLASGRPHSLQPLAAAALAATPLAAGLIAVACTRPGGPRTGPLLIAAELRAAGPAIAFGAVAAGLLIFPIAAGPEGHGGLNPGALLAAVPVSLSMGGAEWTLRWYRRRTRLLLGSRQDLAGFRRRARLLLAAALAQYVCGTAALIAAAAAVAAATGLAQPGWDDVPELAAYLMLGAAMFLALLLQTMRLRAVPLLAGAAALGAEIALRGQGMIVQVLTPAVLLVVLARYAAAALGSAARHGY